ncbi:hypothetical protein D3C75_955590 [compost metagenome]
MSDAAVYFTYGIILFLGILLIARAIQVQRRQKAEIIETQTRLKLEYDEALKEMSIKKGVPEARVNALEKGRAYYSFFREGRVLTVADETAIANDMMAHGVTDIKNGTGS